MRFETVDACQECGWCTTHRTCDPIRKKLRAYDGIRFTSDSFDCALPVSIDSHSHCSYGCLYCFADNLVQHRPTELNVGQTRLSHVEAIFAGEGGAEGVLYRQALKYDARNAQGYPCPVQLGAICDPCDNIERNQGWLLQFINLAIKYQQPVRMSTKGKIFQLPEYLQAVAKAPELFWVAFSIITPDDELLEKIDVAAPNATERLKTMAALHSVGVKTSLRFRPMLPGVSDHTHKHPKAYKELLERAREAGAGALSTEIAFMPGSMTSDIRRRWQRLCDITGIDFFKLYASFGPLQSCTRPSYTWAENYMHSLVEEAHKLGYVVGISDPVWKQLTDTGCCCGILPDDPVFGNWQRESATNQLLEAKTTGKLLHLADITPTWAREARLDRMVHLGVGPKIVWKRKHTTWADKLRDNWNDLAKERSPLVYFQGALMPVDRDNQGDLVYKYVGLQRQHQHGKYWQVDGNGNH